MGWFTVNKIDDNTYVISENGHWENTNCYLLTGKDSAVLIDSGLGVANIKEEIKKLTDMPVKVITTHAHWDHIGCHKYFNDIYIHEDDSEWIINGLPLPSQAVIKNLTPENFTGSIPPEFDIKSYRVFRSKDIKILKDGDIIDIGRKLRIIHTPGHSPGHICIFDESNGYMFTGDLIYKGTLYAFYPSTDPVKYRESVIKISNTEGIKKVFPGHYDYNQEKDIIKETENAFNEINKKNRLKQGEGIFEFENIKIQI